MSPTRREFLWTMSAATAALALQGQQDVFWTPEDVADSGWAPGIEDRFTSACLICPARCGLRGRVVDGNLVRLTGNPLHPMSRGGLCPRGVAGVQMLYHPERLASPLVREGERGAGQWRQVSGEDAIALISERLQSLRADGRPEGLALLSGYCAGTMHDLWRQFLQSFGSPNHVADDYGDGTEVVMSLMHGIARRPSYDFERARYVLSFGAPLYESFWSPLQAFVGLSGHAKGEEERRPRFVQVDTRFSRTAARAHEWVGIQPGTHAVLALGIAYVLIRDELYDASFVARRVSGFEDFTDERGSVHEGYRSLVTRNFRTEEVSAITGVPIERITTLAKNFAANGAGVAVCGSDVMLAENGLLAGLAVHSLNVLLGSVSRPGTVLFGDDPPLAPLVAPALDDLARRGLESAPLGGPTAPFSSGVDARRFAQASADSEVRTVEALLLYYANPLASSTHPEVWRSALDNVPFIVSFSPFLDETTMHADVVLPDLLAYERWQDAPTPASYPYPVWGLARPMVEPSAGGTHTGDALLRIAQHLGGSVAESLPYESFEALLESRAEGLFSVRRGMTLGDEFERRHHRQMEERGWWLPEHTDIESFWEQLIERGGWTDLFYDETDPARVSRTADGRIHLMPAALEEALEEQGLTLRPYVNVAADDRAAGEDFPLRLLPYRLSTLSSGTLYLERWLAEQPTIFPNVLWDPWVELNPETAHELGFGDGSMAWVVSERGRYRARVKVFPGIARENVGAPYGLRHPKGDLANPLQLLNGSVDPLTGLPSWYSTFVRLESA